MGFDKKATEWIYSNIVPVINPGDYVGYGDASEPDCKTACKEQIEIQNLTIGN
jgi:hypothetical protein